MKSTLAIIVLISGISSISSAQSAATPKNEITYKGNKFVLSTSTDMDTTVVTDPITGNTTAKITNAAPFPISVNGKPVYNLNTTGVKVKSVVPGVNIEEQIIKNISNALNLSTCPDGILEVNLKHLIIDEHGNIIYNDFSGISLLGTDKFKRSLIVDKPDLLCSSISNLPTATYYDKPAVYNQRVSFNRYLIQVKDHSVSYRIN